MAKSTEQLPVVGIRIIGVHVWSFAAENSFQDAAQCFADEQRLCAVVSQVGKAMRFAETTRGIHRSADHQRPGHCYQLNDVGRLVKKNVFLRRRTLKPLREMLVQGMRGVRHAGKRSREQPILPREEWS